MSGPDLDAAQLWIALALGDLKAAETLAVAEDPAALRIAAQHAQQAAEKGLKAASAAGGMRPPRSHDLVALAQSVPAAAAVQDLAVDLDALTAAYAAGRYPDPAEPAYAANEVAHLLDAARALNDRIVSYLATLGLDDVEPR